MKNNYFKIIILIILISVIFFILKILVDAGVFLEIKPHGTQSCIPIKGIQGPEDIEKIDESSVLISSFSPKGGIYYYSTKSPNQKPILLTQNLPFSLFAHGLDVAHSKTGQTWVYVINHPLVGAVEKGDRIEVLQFELKNQNPHLTHIKTIQGFEGFYNLNDLEVIGEDQFFFTKDHAATTELGKKIEDFSRMGRGALGFYDVGKVKWVYQGLTFPNGVAKDEDRDILFVASMLGKQILKFKYKPTGEVELFGKMLLNTAPDNLSYESKTGALWVGAHPKLLSLKNHSEDHAFFSPAQILKVYPNLNLSTEKPIAAIEVLLDTGAILSASSVAVPLKTGFLVGSIFQDRFLYCSY